MSFKSGPSITLQSNGRLNPVDISLSSSKSESNRALVINALAGNRGILRNLSDARDTRTMQRLLQSDDLMMDVADAGTTMRFLTGFLALTTPVKKSLTGSARMQERPIKILVDALREIGADISYLKKEGFPPLEIAPFSKQKTNSINIPSDISSQYISALLMIAPKLQQGLKIELEGEVYSKPYIRMTLALMEKFGVSHQWKGKTIRIPPQGYSYGEYSIESDWSGASYWYGFMSLASEGSLRLLGLRKDSYQGDQAIVDIMRSLGVESAYSSAGVVLTKMDAASHLEIDFRHCPDLAQTVMVSAAGQKINLSMTGLESLKIKETDRINALQKELGKMNVELTEGGNSWHLNSRDFSLEPGTVFETYDDHRMAMAFAPLSMIAPICIENPSVVEKSYPGFWEDLDKVVAK